MQIEEVSLLEFMAQPGVQFTIPRFQRAYSWRIEQCEELWRDLFRAARAGRSHFVGTVIYLNDIADEAPRAEADAQAAGQTGETRPVSIIDGQQRLTTVSLMLKALADYLSANDATLFGIDADYLKRTYLANGDEPKLSPSRTDRATLTAILCDAPLPENPAPRACENLAWFQAKMAEKGFDPLQLWSGLQALTAISVRLDDRTQAPAIFENFNSKGAPLVTADLVRNFLLLAESHSEQARLYEQYWKPIQGVFGDDPGSIRLNNAILGWLAVRLREVRKFGDAQAFSIFKTFCEDEYDGTVDDLLEELYAFCMVWAENYRYHAVKKYKTADWARLGHKTRVSNRKRAPLDDPNSGDYYKKHYGVDPQW